jgi:hypothetical protein
MLRRFSWTCLVATLALALPGCKSSSGPQLDANSNWLRLCDIDSDCLDSGQCVCGLCSDTCTSDAECTRGSTEGTCVTSPSGPAGHRCAQDRKLTAAPLCLPECTHEGGCAPDFYCDSGACWPISVGSAPTRGLHTSAELSSYDVAASFDAVPVLPTPELVIRTDGADTSTLYGVWFGDQHMRLEVRHSDELGGDVATLSVDCLSDRCDATDIANRSTADTVLDQDAYLTREQLVAGLTYRAYDGRFNRSGFTFWLSNNELWKGWCELQRSRAIEIDGRTAYACGSGTTRDATPSTEDSTGRDLLCEMDDGVCSCNAASCSWNPYTSVTSFELVPDGGVLRGAIKAAFTEPTPTVFARTSEVAP